MAAIFRAVYSASWRRAPMQTPSAHRGMQSSSRQSPFVAVTDAVCGTHKVRATRLRRIEETDDMKHYARTTYIRARLCLVNSGLDPIAAIRFGMNVNTCACNMICYGMKMNVRTHHVICFGMKMYVRVYHTICFGMQDVCSHALYNMLWCAI